MDFTKISDTDKGYLAGLIDGEGSVFIMRQRPTSKKSGNVSTDYAVRVTVANTDKAVLEWVQSLCGGLVLGPAKCKNPRWKPVWTWRITRQDAVDFLREIRGLLRIKGTQAWLALEFNAQKTSFARTGLGVRLTVEELALREGYALAMQYLNARGI